jgi:hypothetical protein
MRANYKKDRIPYGRRSLRLAAGIFNQPAAEKAVCIHRPTHATKQFEGFIKISGMLKCQSRSGKWKNRLKNWITPPT